MSTAVKHLLQSVVLLIALLGCGKSDSQPKSGKPAAGTGDAPVPQISMIKMAPRILIEAENGKIQPPMKVFRDAKASQGGFVEAPEGPNHKEISIGGSVTHTFVVEEPGAYVLWIRKSWTSGCGNSLTVSVDGGKEITFGGDATYGKWDWKRVPDPAQPGQPLLCTLTKGTHTIAIGNREDGSRYDQILLIQDSEYVPVSIEKE